MKTSRDRVGTSVIRIMLLNYQLFIINQHQPSRYRSL